MSRTGREMYKDANVKRRARRAEDEFDFYAKRSDGHPLFTLPLPSFVSKPLTRRGPFDDDDDDEDYREGQ